MIFNISKEELVNKKAIHTASEIYQQPKTWLKTLNQIENEKDEIKNFIDEILNQDDYDIILTGAGTSEFVGNSVFPHLNTIYSHKVKSYATTEIVATPEAYLSKTKPTLLISFARSGNSPESVGAVEVANIVCDNVKHLFITCNENGALSKIANEVDNAYAIRLTKETHDESFAMTSSFSNMLLAVLLALNTDKLASFRKDLSIICEKTEKLLNTDYKYFEEIVNNYDFKRIVYLGSNNHKGIAQESALKLLELAAGKIVTMYDSILGFRHGPKSIVNNETLVVMYLSDDEYTYQYELDLIKEMSKERDGNKLLVISNSHKDVASLVDYYYNFDNENLDNVLTGLEFITAAQIIALFKSLSINNTPDTPCSTGTVNRVVQGVIIHPYKK